MTSALQYALSFCDAINMAPRRQQRFVRRYQIFMKHSRNIVRLAITFTLILIGLLSMPGAGRQTKASAAHAAPFSSGVAAQGLMTESSLAVGGNADGRLEVFAEGTDRALWHKWQLTPGGDSWSGWASLGTEAIDMFDPAVARNADGRLVVFVGDTDGCPNLIWQLPGGGWNRWAHFAGCGVSSPILATNADGRLEGFARRSDGALWHAWQLYPNNDGWNTGWYSLGGVIIGSPAVGKNADGRLEVFVWWTDGSIRHNWQLTPGNTGRVEPPGQAWSDWHTL